MRLTRASDYALRVLIHLAHPDGATRTTREDIIDKTGAPAAFLNKLVQRLAHAGLLKARPGVRGGCVLAMPADAISVLKVIEAIDGPLDLSKCLADSSVCPHCSTCNLRRLLAELQKEMVRILSTAKISDLVNSVAKSPCLVPLASIEIIPDRI
jgi:Rrf2 family protein